MPEFPPSAPVFPEPPPSCIAFGCLLDVCWSLLELLLQAAMASVDDSHAQTTPGRKDRPKRLQVITPPRKASQAPIPKTELRS